MNLSHDEDDTRSLSSERSPARSSDEPSSDGSDGHGGASSDVEDAIYGTAYEDTTIGGENIVESFRIDHTRGEHRLPVNAFLRRTTATDLTSRQAIGMMQRRYTFDFGSRASGSRHCTADDALIPTFHLDMIALVGRPMKPIVHRSERFFDNVTISFQNWAAPYRAKHVEGGIGFDLRHRTFRVASGSTRESWFIVMHPGLAISDIDRPRAEIEASIRNSALEDRHARFLAEYIKYVFLSDDLVGEGVEAAWRLGQSRSENITFNKWATFQYEFMAGWSEYVAARSTDPFWTENRPAFHAYDYGANIILDVTQQMETLDKEEPMQGVTDDDLSDGEEAAAVEAPTLDGATERDADGALYTEGLHDLRVELEAKFDLDNIWSMSYALAVDLYCLDGEETETHTRDRAARCMLADRNAVMQEFPRQRDWTFYPVGFSPIYGNFAASQPPEFLKRNVLTVMRNNLSIRNEGVDVLTCGYFQAYSNVKRSIRHRPDDLLAKKSLTTAVLSLPGTEITSNQVRTKHRQLEAQMKGMRTPEDRDQSRPFAREAQRIQAAIEGEDYGYRMEQVVSMHVARLCEERRTFTTILHPIFQLMRFYLREPHQYRHVLHTFLPEVYPGVLRGFSTLFDKAMVGLQEKCGLLKQNTCNVAIAEAAAAFDRMGSYLFSGSAKVVNNSVLRHLGTKDSLRYGGWPFIDPGVLDVQDESASVKKAKWPQRKDGQPALLHPAVLDFYYGKYIGAARQSNAWLQDFRGMEVAGRNNATNLLVDIFGHMWVPQTIEFVSRAVERLSRKWIRASDNTRADEVTQKLEEWAETEHPFVWSAYSKMVPILSSDTHEQRCAVKSRRDVATELYEAARENTDRMRRRWAAQEASWLAVLSSAISVTDTKVVSADQWIGAISSAMLECRIEAMPGASRGKLSSGHVVRLVGMAPSQAMLATRPGTLKRAAVEANESAKRPRLQARIDFGCELPFVRIPRLVDEGLRAQDKLFEGGDQRIREHYCMVRHCLDACLGDPVCDLMLMFSLTLASCSVTPAVNSDGFDVGKKKDPHVFVANLVTRMLWFLKPQEFPWTAGEGGGIMSVPEMTKKIGKEVA